MARAERTIRVEVQPDGSNPCLRRLRSFWGRNLTGMTESGIGPGAKSHYLDPRSSERGPCYSLTRLFMFIFTGLFFILGIVILAVGIAVRTDADFKAAVSDHAPGANVGAGLFIFVGLVMILTGFVGCLGAVRESRCLLFSVSGVRGFLRSCANNTTESRLMAH
ncbi:hypothetical protein BOX15_Mlig029381g1 [Macrostomum lignano]|uniref:Tetraspanin n=2 Tax=Macrostomum lignano TaxID=282301 RepID=A0A267FAN3_9PLAT|nr:hypothetical protein BOX15_Mlig029381g1 [Macrostomum lignano]